jgi:hypothetical protein
MEITIDDVRNLQPGDEVRVPLEPEKWRMVTEIIFPFKDNSLEFTIGTGEWGFRRQLPLEIRKKA